MVENEDYRWFEHDGVRYMLLSESGFKKIVQLKIDWNEKRK